MNRFLSVLSPIAVLVCVSVGVAQEDSIVLACSGAEGCDDADFCGGVRFELAPTDIAANGSGTYVLRYNDLDFQANTLTAEGPLVWSTDDETRYKLSVSDDQGGYLLQQFLSTQDTPNLTLNLTCGIPE